MIRTLSSILVLFPLVHQVYAQRFSFGPVYKLESKSYNLTQPYTFAIEEDTFTFNQMGSINFHKWGGFVQYSSESKFSFRIESGFMFSNRNFLAASPERINVFTIANNPVLDLYYRSFDHGNVRCDVMYKLFRRKNLNLSVFGGIGYEFIFRSFIRNRKSLDNLYNSNFNANHDYFGQQLYEHSLNFQHDEILQMSNYFTADIGMELSWRQVALNLSLGRNVTSISGNSHLEVMNRAELGLSWTILNRTLNYINGGNLENEHEHTVSIDTRMHYFFVRGTFPVAYFMKVANFNTYESYSLLTSQYGPAADNFGIAYNQYYPNYEIVSIQEKASFDLIPGPAVGYQHQHETWRHSYFFTFELGVKFIQFQFKDALYSQDVFGDYQYQHYDFTGFNNGEGVTVRTSVHDITVYAAVPTLKTTVYIIKNTNRRMSVIGGVGLSLDFTDTFFKLNQYIYDENDVINHRPVNFCVEPRIGLTRSGFSFEVQYSYMCLPYFINAKNLGLGNLQSIDLLIKIPFYKIANHIVKVRF